MNLLSSARLRQLTGYPDAEILGRVAQHNFLLGTDPGATASSNTSDAETMLRRIRSQIFRALFLPIGMSFLLSSFTAYPVIEKTSGSKNLQLMTGISGGLYWLSNYMFDMLIYAVLWVAIGGMFAYFYRVTAVTAGE